MLSISLYHKGDVWKEEVLVTEGDFTDKMKDVYLVFSQLTLSAEFQLKQHKTFKISKLYKRFAEYKICSNESNS